jgi:hypothetical protein
MVDYGGVLRKNVSSPLQIVPEKKLKTEIKITSL